MISLFQDFGKVRLKKVEDKNKMTYDFLAAQVAGIQARKPWVTAEYLLRTDKTPRPSLVQQLYDSLNPNSNHGPVRVMTMDDIADFCIGQTDDPVAQQELFTYLIMEPGVDF